MKYICAMCKNAIEYTEEEDAVAKEELQKNFPGSQIENCGIVCDDCYPKIMDCIII